MYQKNVKGKKKDADTKNFFWIGQNPGPHLWKD